MSRVQQLLAARMSERELHGHVLTLASGLGVYVWHDAATNHPRRCWQCGALQRGPRNAAGLPDDLLLGRGWAAWAEEKTRTGTLEPEQVAMHARLRAAGQTVYVFRPADLADGTIARVLRGE